MTVLETPVPRRPQMTADLSAADKPISLKRRTLDSIAAATGGVIVVVLAVAGSLLMWGASFSRDYVHDELASQHVAFPPAAALRTEGRTDLLSHAGQTVDSGADAKAYASYIAGHLDKIGAGKTYADLGTPEREAQAAVTAAKASGADAATLAKLQADSDAITAQRNTLFKGETLRGLLLSAFAWATVGQIAGYASLAAFAAAVVMLILVAFGIRHHHQLVADA
jgi:hypothetical protein